MTVREWMQEDYVNATKKRNIEDNAKREHFGTSPKRVSTETGYRDFLFGAKAKQQKEKTKEEVKGGKG